MSTQATNHQRPNPIVSALPAPERRELARLAAALGRSLPPALLDLLSRCNGAVPTRRGILFADTEGYVLAHGLRAFYAAHHPQLGRQLEDTWRALVRERRDMRDSLLPIGDDEGGDQYCLDLDTGEVFAWLHETGEEFFVANSVTEFLERMVPLDDIELDPRWLGMEPWDGRRILDEPAPTDLETGGATTHAKTSAPSVARKKAAPVVKKPAAKKPAAKKPAVKKRRS